MSEKIKPSELIHISVDVLKQIRHLDIKHKMEHGSFFLPQEIREKIHAILLGCE